MRAHVLAITGVLWFSAGRATAGVDHTCVLDDVDEVTVDGMLDDWKGVAKVRAGGAAADASFDVYCVYDDTRVALAFDVRDDKVIRVKKGPAREDHVALELVAGGTPLVLALYPGALGANPRRTAGGKALPSWISIEDTLQDKGFSLEVVVPFARLAGYSTASPAITARATFKDADQATAKTSDDVAIELALAFGAKVDLMKDFLRTVGATAADVKLDQQADLDRGRAGPERVVLAGTTLGVLGDQFNYVALPAQAAADVSGVKIVDWHGDGRKLVAAVVRQRAGNGSRDVLGLYGVDGGQVKPVISVEIRKDIAGDVLASTWKLVPVKVKGKARIELVVQAGPATGFDPEAYFDQPSTDVKPINLPWDEDRYGTAFWLEAGAIKQRIIPMPKPRK